MNKPTINVQKDPYVFLSVEVKRNGRPHHQRRLPFWAARIPGKRNRAFGAGTNIKSAIKNLRSHLPKNHPFKTADFEIVRIADKPKPTWLP